MTKVTQKQIDASLAALKAQIADAVESAVSMRNKVQTALVGCLSHWNMTGSNAGLKEIINTFIGDLDGGVNTKAVVEWCSIHLAMIPNADQSGLVFDASRKPSTTKKAAADKPWYKHKKQNPFAFDLDTAILSVLKKAEKAEKALVEDGDADVRIDHNTLVALKTVGAKVQQRVDAAKAAAH